MSWDAYGVYRLDGDKSLTTASKEIVQDILGAELGRAEGLARHRLSVDKEDLVPSWALTQIVRFRKTALPEYRSLVRNRNDAGVSVPILLYRFGVCRLAFLDLIGGARPDLALYRELDDRLKSLRDRLRDAAEDRLGVAISLTGSVPFWVLSDRAILESYSQAHPKGPDVRPLICRAYLNGTRSEKGVAWPDSPNPQKAFDIAQTILHDRPNDPLGLYYRGRSRYALKKTDAAIQDIKMAVATKNLPPILDLTARNFLKYPDPRAFYSVRVVN